MVLWCSGYHYLLHNFIQFNKAWAQVLCRFKSSALACWRFEMVRISDNGPSLLEVRLNPFRQSTIPQKQFIIIFINYRWKEIIKDRHGRSKNSKLTDELFAMDYLLDWREMFVTAFYIILSLNLSLDIWIF